MADTLFGLESTYTIGLGCIQNILLLLFTGALLSFVCYVIQLLNLMTLLAKLEPNYCLLKLHCRQTLKIFTGFFSFLHMYLVYKAPNLFVKQLNL